MDRSQIPPLRTLNLQPRPITSHSLSWSQDGELAVATDDGLHVYLPEYPPAPQTNTAGDPGRRGHVGSLFVAKDQFSILQQISSRIRPIGAINDQLFASKGLKPPYGRDDDAQGGEEGGGGGGAAAAAAGSASAFHGVGGSSIVGRGAAMFQVVRVEWSPAGLGVKLRPVVTAMLTSGHLVTFGEIADQDTLSFSGLRNRSFKGWRILWGLGGSAPLPDADDPEGYRIMDERITSFSWAKTGPTGRGLLAYMNDEEDIVIMSVQYLKAREGKGLGEGWAIEEVARFRASNPHQAKDEAVDPDFVPFKSSFALKWSPWVEEDSQRTATLAYMTNNHVGFRRVTVETGWQLGTQPSLQVEATDTVGICVSLQTDATIEWEDARWEEDGVTTARGVLTTPFDLKPFEVPLTGPLNPAVAAHDPKTCSTVYPERSCTNPITGLVVHPPPASKPPVPFYTVTRLSATAANSDWYETNRPQRLIPSDFAVEETASPLSDPSWVSRIQRATSKRIPRSAIFGDPSSDANDSESEDLSDEDEVPQGPAGTSSSQPLTINPWRYRIWGLASSPGGHQTAVVVSKYPTYYPTRKGACHIYLDANPATSAPAARSSLSSSSSNALTTEGKMWEWMYGDGPPPYDPSITDPTHPNDLAVKPEAGNADALPYFFQGVLQRQKCEFCDGDLAPVGDAAAWCQNGHAWARCSATGLAIMQPGASDVCAVCAARSLKRSELDHLARTYLGGHAKVPETAGGCGRCGGKFM